MEKIIQLTHITEYQYDKKIQIFPQYLRLTPSNHCKLPIDSFQLDISPQEHFIHQQQDVFGNQITRVAFKKASDFFKITVNLKVHWLNLNPFDFLIDQYAENYPFDYANNIQPYLTHYLIQAEPSETIKQWLIQYSPNTKNTIDFCCEVNKTLYQEIQYITREDPGVQSVSTTLETKQGSCRDTAWALCELLRAYGFASRFVSGYLLQLNKKTNSNTDSELHAWTEIFIPGAGWIGLDPTSGLLTGQQHIPLCGAPHPNDAAPISGKVQACHATMKHKIVIDALETAESRANKTSTTVWKKIHALGLMVDDSLATHHVNLTMGAEPTYLAEDNCHAPEWQTEAWGTDKACRGWTLLQNLGQRFSPKGLCFTSQGKTYPGEAIPRWAYHYYWRKDGENLWNLPSQPHHQYDLNTAFTFLKTLAKTLKLPENAIQTAYSDFEYEAWRQEYTRKKNTVHSMAAYVLPLHWNNQKMGWITCQWKSMEKHIFLIPGESAAGYRLPLDRLISYSDPRFELSPEKSLFEKDKPLPSSEQLSKMIEARYHCTPSNDTILKHTLRTAVCIECKGNELYLFIPPLSQLESFIDLIKSIEYTSKKTKISVLLNGYCPPIDNRLNYFSVTPDPGVLEINIHPSKTWQEIVEKNRIIEEEAKKCHLTTTKTMPNGRIIASGGGNHITLGGETPNESPFLQRPDLLQSLISFWQHHPSLSYFFSGLFVGPTSQAPRIDEARHDSLYEIELAFQQLSSKKNKPYWEIDRLFRHLLTDMTGNQHRAEFCIDKLFCPDSESGRQGLLELRAFEMAPTPQETLLQILLVRALLITFWQEPYQQPLIRWGTQLHDRFFLPHFLWADLADILNILKKQGYPFELEWFQTFYDFRFPLLGNLYAHNICLELRVALEPWHVIGTGCQNTSRTVDSSLERIQVKITGLIPQQHQICCNGIVLPLHCTGMQGEYIAAVRFKARKNPITTHPNIPLHTPLQFDIIERQHQRAIASCHYHSHNMNDVEIAISDHFEIISPSAKLVTPIEATVDPEFPFTLDLRKF
jgi:uncharacterized protein (DUF2126 family)/transglutaminase-like putative cysteine protease